MYFNPHHPYGRRPNIPRRKSGYLHFNPHRPHGRRPVLTGDVVDALVISIHTAHTGGDEDGSDGITPHIDISIHTAHTGGDLYALSSGVSWIISIHTAHTGGDIGIKKAAGAEIEFQSTPPTRAATGLIALLATMFNISIHTAHTGGD